MPNNLFYHSRVRYPVVGTFLNPASSEVRVVFNLGQLYAVVKIFDAHQPSHTVKFMEPNKFEDTLKFWRTVRYPINPDRVAEAYVVLMKYLAILRKVRILI